jgi:methylisocitrate lyase
MTWLIRKDDSLAKKNFKNDLNSGRLLKFVGAWSPYIALMAEKIGYDGIYISGAGIANDLGFPDIGLTTLNEVVARGKAVARCTSLPTLIDIDTGFGETMNVARTIRELEDAGITACHMEDQVNPKRCGHLDSKQLVDCKVMVEKISAAARSKRNKDFILCARTDARSVEGLEASIQRAQAYVDAGADMIFPEALQDEKEFEAFRKAIKVPLLANMTEFGKSRLLDATTLSNLGMNMVIYPMTAFRLAMKAVEDGLKEILEKGTQEGLLNKMQTRSKLYEYLEYEKYNDFDQALFNFKLKSDQ